MDELVKTKNELKSLLGEMRELSQNRSNYALEHFVVCDYDTPTRQRKQVLDELYSLMFALADMEDERELCHIKIEKLKSWFMSAEKKIEVRKLERSILSLDIAIEGRLGECRALFAMLNKLPKVTRAEFEAQEPDYWKRRIERQFQTAQINEGGNLNLIKGISMSAGDFAPKSNVNIDEIKGLVSHELASRNLITSNSD